jgi:hypothetical protein
MYTVELGKTIDRIKTIQLGSFQFTDFRYAFDDTAELKYSEPITIPADTYLSFRETTTTITKATNTRVDESRIVSILVPPTINEITGMAGDMVTAQNDTGLFFASNYYPEVNLRMRVTGADFPQDLQAFVTPSFPTIAGPILNAATTVSPYVTTGDSTMFTYQTDYLDELMGGVGDKVLRHRSAGAYTSYLTADKPTLVELFVMLNAAIADMTRRTDITGTVVGATNATPIVVSTAAPLGVVTGDQVVISGVTGNTAANSTFIVTTLSTTTFELDSSVGNGGYVAGGTLLSPQKLGIHASFGFDNESNEIAVFGATRVEDRPRTHVTRKLSLVGSLADLLGFGSVNVDPIAHSSGPNTIKRPVPLKPGNFTPAQLVDDVPFRMNAGSFLLSGTETRRFFYTLPIGISTSFVIDYGRYTGTQLADYMTAIMGPLPAQITVTYSAATRLFTFSHSLGLAFGLDFESANELIREKFGFDSVVLSGQSTYTSSRPGVYGVLDGATFPDNTYDLLSDGTSNHFTFRTEAPTPFYTLSGTSTSNVGASWDPLALEELPYAHQFKVGDVLTAVRPTLSSTQDGTKNITGATNAEPIEITTALAHGLTTGDNLTIQFVNGNEAANGTWYVTVTAATTFTLDDSDGDGTYNLNTGEWWTNSSFVGAAQAPSAQYTVVVQSVWDASTATPLLTLEPTASIFSVQDAGTANREPLGTPGDTDARILLKPARRNVFMFHPEHPQGRPDTFGFPSVAWPPSEKAILSPSTTGIQVLRTLPGYDAATLSIPVSNTYTSPFTWNLLPPDYMVIVLHVNCSATDIHTHSYRGTSFPIFAKMLLTFPYTNILEEMLFTSFPGFAKMSSLGIEFQNPDGSPVQFNGRPHTFTLLFTVEEDQAVLPCF